MLDRPEDTSFIGQTRRRLELFRLKLNRRFKLGSQEELKMKKDAQFQHGVRVVVTQRVPVQQPGVTEEHDGCTPESSGDGQGGGSSGQPIEATKVEKLSGIIWKRHTQYTVGQVRRNEFNYDVMITHGARRSEVLPAVHWTLIEVEASVPGCPGVPFLTEEDFEYRRGQIARFGREYYDYNIRMDLTSDEALRRVYTELFMPRWNEGQLTNSYYHHDRIFFHAGLWWKQEFLDDEDKMFFTFTCRETGEIVLENPMTVEAVRDKVWAAFNKFDIDNSGTLERDEVAEMLAYELFEPVSEKELDVAMRDLDEDGNGHVEFQEFLLWYVREMETDYRTSDKMSKLREKLKQEAAARKVRKALATLGPTAEAQQKFKKGITAALDNAKKSIKMLGKDPVVFELTEEGYDKPAVEKALAVMAGDVDAARVWLDKHHPAGTKAKGTDLISKMTAFLDRKKKLKERQEIDQRREEAKQAFKLQVRRIDATLEGDELGMLDNSAGTKGCTLCPCDEFFPNIVDGTCAACGHPEEEHTIVYEWEEADSDDDEMEDSSEEELDLD
eukprot:INCI5086.1.p1 GENE.INCI5086.1~~INCI5086.1.p1  ORF type:complete len:556 (+),score=132.68 INCI5086.1:275-1942(+)